MKLPIQHLSKKHFYLICCFVLITNNVFAVKSAIHPAQKMETISDSIPSELILIHRSGHRSPKKIRAGQIVKVRTKNKETYRGELNVIDEDYIEVGWQKIALEHVAKIKHKYKRRKMFFGVSLMLFGLLIAFVADRSISGNIFAENVGYYIIAAFGIFIIVPIGIIVLAFPIVYFAKSWLFSTKDKDKDDVLYRRRES